MMYHLAPAPSTAILALIGIGASPAADRSIARIDRSVSSACAC